MFISISSYSLERVLKSENEEENLLKKLIKRVSPKWYLWVLMTIHNRQRIVTVQMYCLSTLLEGMGLSNRGQNVLALMGLGLHKSTLIRELKLALSRHDENVRGFMESNRPHVFWIDNFTKYYRHLQAFGNDWKYCRWTPCALVMSPSNIICPMNFVTDHNNNRFESWPRYLLEKSHIWYSMFSSMSKELDSSLYETSLIKSKFQLCFPFSSQFSDDIIENEIPEEGLSAFGLKYFFPLEMLRFDCQSNWGLCKVLKHLLLLNKHSRHTGYFLVKSDINIYYRYMKMIFGPTDVAPSLRLRMCMILGFWHPFKLAMEKLWSHPLLFPTIIAPSCHAIHPNNCVFKSTKLTVIGQTFTVLILAYPHFRNKLTSLKQNRDQIYGKNHIRNIHFFFEILLPTVNLFLLLIIIL